jgi:NADPH:quinone reductase-like Zn-dependent oxidoreductase
MKAIHLTAYGNPAQNLRMVEVPEPNAPTAGEALVRMEYAPVDYSDLLLANGVYFLKPQPPSVIGGEGAGIVEAIGPGVTSVKVGDRVTIPFGTFTWSEKVLAQARGLFVVPPSVDAKTASVLNINPTTAVLLLDEFVKLKAKNWIVLNAANSHVARCLIAIAKSRDLNVVGIVRRPELIPEIEKLNVDHLVSYAWLSGLPIHVPQGDLIGKRLNIHGFWMYYEEYLPKMRAALTEATKVVASGKLSLPITTTYKPSQIKEAIEHAQRGGKVLLDFNCTKVFPSGVSEYSTLGGTSAKT